MPEVRVFVRWNCEERVVGKEGTRVARELHRRMERHRGTTDRPTIEMTLQVFLTAAGVHSSAFVCAEGFYRCGVVVSVVLLAKRSGGGRTQEDLG